MTQLTPRKILTALLNRISSIPLSSDDPSSPSPNIKSESPETSSSNSNPLRLVPISHRHLLITLHVLFPGMVLPAFDLLDRKLITRLLLDSSLNWIKPEPGTKEEPETSPKAYTPSKQTAEVYVVYSSASHNNNQGLKQGGGYSTRQKYYIVSLKAWNCTCAAFAFATVQGVPISDDNINIDIDISEETKKENEWSFGGLTLDNNSNEKGGGIPICKHLLACLLAERWSNALGEYVMEKRVGKEEMAGVVADI